MSDKNPVPQSGLSSPPVETTSSPALEQYQETARKSVECRKEEILLCLRLAGIARVEMQYDGCGDSGQIEDVSLWDAQKREIPARAIGKAAQTLEDFLYDLLEARHDGWENGDGASGEFAWDIVEDLLTHTHNDRFTDYTTTEHEGV